MAGPALAVMARVPSPEGKSRLGGFLTPGQREELQWAMLLDMVDKMKLLPVHIKSFIAATPADQIPKMRPAVNTGTDIIPQAEGGLGLRMLEAARNLYGRGHCPVVIVGTDIPAINAEYITLAVDLLNIYDVVLGPATDGGYCLLGMRRPEARIFENITWGADSVLGDTVDICRRCKISYTLIDTLRDIDLPGDLEALARQIRQEHPDAAPAPNRTARFVRKLFFNSKG